VAASLVAGIQGSIWFVVYRIHQRLCRYCQKIGVYCKELCKGCYGYLRKYGTLVRPRITVEDRFWAKVDKSNDCWNWTGAKNRKGYGSFSKYGQYSPMAHRTSWMIMCGSIPTGLQLDHLCRNTSCVNPDHLEPVTSRENMDRAKAARTSCKNGHPYEGSNVRIDQNGRRWCRTCVANNHARFLARNPNHYKTYKRPTVRHRNGA
jgi:HNH endonuclease